MSFPFDGLTHCSRVALDRPPSAACDGDVPRIFIHSTKFQKKTCFLTNFWFSLCFFGTTFPQVSPCQNLRLKFVSLLFWPYSVTLLLSWHLNFTFSQESSSFPHFQQFLPLPDGRDSSVGTATPYGLDGPGIKYQRRRDFPDLSRPALEPMQPPLQ